jgi:hypothetical protein
MRLLLKTSYGSLSAVRIWHLWARRRQATKGWFHDDEQESGSEGGQRAEQ